MNGPSVGTILLAVLIATSGVGGGAALLAASSGLASAGHGEEDANSAIEPQGPADRKPGATNALYGQTVVIQAGVDLETLEGMKAVYEEGSWADCGPNDAEEFGIDRGNNTDGYETDEDLDQYVKRFSAGEDVLEAEFRGEDDIGSSTHLNDGDAIVSLVECLSNPDEPGWYQISGSVRGVTRDGEEVTLSGESHYFWICECSSEEEAREELGPPPSEDSDTEDEQNGGDEETNTAADGDGTGTSTAQASTTSAEETRDGADGKSTDDGSDDGDAGTPGETPTTDEDSDNDAAAQGDESTATADDNWDEVRVQTPAKGDGPGFGPDNALVALLGAAMLLQRRI